MRDLQKVAHECLEEVRALGIPVWKILSFEVNTRARNRWGQCKHRPEGHYININVALLDERNDINGLKNTVIHEILHTCPGCQNHGAKWKGYAAMVNRAYGYGIKRCSSADEKGVLEETRIQKKEMERKYAIQCVDCGLVTRRTRETKVIKYPNRYICAKCHGKLVRIA